MDHPSQKILKPKGKRLSATTEKPIHLGSNESPFYQALAEALFLA